MLKCVKVQCPAKINLSLKVTAKRDDGFHNIDSIMQTIDLFDYLTIEVEPFEMFAIELSGNSTEIPYNNKNLVYKAADLFFTALKDKINPHKIKINIEKNIPIAAGLAGGSTDAAGTLYGLNNIFSQPLTNEELHKLCAMLGSDLNFCLEGGCKKAIGRGEILENQVFEEISISLIKPVSLGISAKEAYSKYAQKNALGLKNLYYANDLEWALIDHYPELQAIKSMYPNSIMSGSGSTYFCANSYVTPQKGYWVTNNLKTIPYGVKIVN